MNYISYAAWLLVALFTLAALFSWVVLLSGRFKPHFMLPCVKKDCDKLAKTLFIIQSLLLLFSAGLVWMRASQLMQAHEDNVISNLIYGLSSLLLIRGIGDFRFMGIFRSETVDHFTKLDRKLFTPLAFLMFVLCLLLMI